MTSFEVYPNPISPDCTDCNPNYGNYRGQKGVTIWGPITFTLQAGQTSDRLYFTFTNPKGYNGLHFCNVTFTLRTDRYVYGSDDAGPIEMWVNNPDDNSNFSNLNYRENQHYHSKVCYDGTEYHDVTETIDISQGHVGTLLNRSGANHICFRNLDQHSVTVTIMNFKIVAGYGMAGISAENGDNCATNGTYPPEHPDFATRQDHPCTYHEDGDQDGDPGKVYGGMGFTGFCTDDHVNTLIAPGDTPIWTWTNPTNPSHSYKGKVSCLFNFNNVHLNQSSTNDDVKFSIQVNNSSWVNFYHTKTVDHPMYHSVDLATHPVLSASGGYDDTPGATNTLRLHLDNNAGASFAICDGCDDPNYPCPSQCIGGRVNLYRVYQTEPLNGQNTITTYQTTGGQIIPNNPQPYAYQSQTFSIAPDWGYVISSVYVDGANVGAVSSYTFDSVTQNHTITANFSQDCQSCVTCQSGCMLCLACYSCYVGCQEGCEVGCQDCQSPCELSCQNCQTCQTTCQVSCDNCQICVSCQESETCPSGYYECQSCETCQPCYSCQATCQTPCQISCQEPCQTACQGCQLCVSCQESESCPSGYYECQNCETCQPSYT